ncbi:hypothetical protein DEO72_LG2g3508 [Vigna unguiculata]|uniref:Uncharacterized protein n=1 Tax=Vigna unguiculata TaxID=3917 RepID=A0A4D6L3X6_VIGUN|nr:hypothetical protein DEO72_LG2g3508 [Vigna unguiculata]
MDQSFLVMLSNLLHLHNSLDPTTSLLSDSLSSTTANPSSLLHSSSIAPLLFFTIASVLSYVASTRPSSSPPNPNAAATTTNNNPNTNANNNASSDYSVSAFRALSTEHIWVMDSEKSFHYYGEKLRQALADDLHHKLSSR